MKNGAIYVRVSTDEQAREGYSIDAQIKAIKEYAIKNNIFIDSQYIFKDEGISGRKAEKRPAFMEMIKIAKSKPKKFDVILVHKFDRFSRNREDSIVYKSLLKKEYGVNVISVCEPLDPDDKMSVILEAFLEAMAEYYSLNLSEEVKKGQLEKHEHGELQTRPSYGYNVSNNKLVINEEEAKIVKLIFESYAIDNMPMLAITRKLYEMNIKNKKGHNFENRSLCYILNNPVYIGKLRYTPGRRNTYDFDDPNTIIVNGEHEPIIDLELWNAAQEKLTQNNKWRRPKQRIDFSIKFWLKGIIRCKECNCTMVIHNRTQLRCNGYNKGRCHNGDCLNIKEVEDLIINQIKHDYSTKIIKNIVDNTKKKDKTNEYTILLDQINSIELKEKRIKDAYIAGIDTIDEYKKNKQILANEKNNLNIKLSSLSKPKSEQAAKKEIIENGKNLYEILTDDHIEITKKYSAINVIINHIEYDKATNQLEIYYNMSL